MSKTCPICQEDMEDNQTYKLPNCEHEYHIECIMAWFRSKQSSCPICRDNGDGETFHLEQESKLTFLRRFAKTKQASSELKRDWAKLIKLEKEHETSRKELNNMIKELKKTEVYRNVTKKESKM